MLDFCISINFQKGTTETFLSHRYLKQNARVSNRVSNITDVARQQLSKWLTSDYKLYNHFAKKLQVQIDNYGREQMEADVKSLREMNSQMIEECVLEVADNSKLKGEFRYLLFVVKIFVFVKRINAIINIQRY